MLRSPTVVQQVANHVTSTGSTTDVFVLSNTDMDSLVFELNVTAAGASTSPTLDVYVQTQDSAGNWRDVARFAQIVATTANPHYALVPISVGSGAVKGAIGDATISASTLGVPILGINNRIKSVNGTSSDSWSYTINVYENQQSGRT